MRHLRSALMAIAFAMLPIVSYAVAVIGAPTPVLFNAVDTTTAIPGGCGAFMGFYSPGPVAPPDPCISAGNLAFWGAGVSGQQGIYALRYVVLGKVADVNTAGFNPSVRSFYEHLVAAGKLKKVPLIACNAQIQAVTA
ncbi:hypothetical protein [Cupriavidus necator]|uniref:hypothetical protein n=1 Tax=Cupriavidus necator TaxID=106590 RepID=UPI001F338C3E|nr:hypothetical protein [Cupriavidus necator]